MPALQGWQVLGEMHPLSSKAWVEISPKSLLNALSIPLCHWELHQSLLSVGGISAGLEVYFTLRGDKHTRPGGSVISAELFPADIGLK